MKLAKGEAKPSTQIVKIELELDKTVVDQLQVMADYTKIAKSDLVTTALKRFISAHKDYFPEDYSR